MPNMNYRGDWNVCTEYGAGDTVLHEGAVWLALRQSAGEEPDAPLSIYWRAFAPGTASRRHNDLEEMQGGGPQERYHLTEEAAAAAEAASGASGDNPLATVGDVIKEHNGLEGLQGGIEGERYHVGRAVADGLGHAASAPSATNPFLTRADVAPLTRSIGKFRRAVTPAGTGTLYGAAWGNGRFVAVGDRAAIGTKTPEVWTNEPMPAGDYRLRGVCFGLDRFVAVGLEGRGLARDDQDGSAWEAITLPGGDWNKVAYGNGKYVAVTDGAVAVSSDGLTGWAKHTVPRDFGNDICFDNGIFIMVGKGGAMTGADGVVWNNHPLPGGTWRGVTAANGQILVVGGKCLETRNRFVDIEERATPTGGWDSVLIGGAFALSVSGRGCMSTQAVTVDWLLWVSLDYVMLGLAFGMNCFVAVGDGILHAGIVDAAEAFQAAASPNADNPFATQADLAALSDSLSWGRIE
jgi:hypothetical protein